MFPVVSNNDGSVARIGSTKGSTMLAMDCILLLEACLIVHLMCMSTSCVGCFQFVLGIAIHLRVKGVWMFASPVMLQSQLPTLRPALS